MLIWGMVELSATSDHLPYYLCPTRLLAIAIATALENIVLNACRGNNYGVTYGVIMNF